MRTAVRHCFSIALFLLAPAPAIAQDTTVVPIGSRVRVALLPGGTMRGVLASSHPDSVALQMTEYIRTIPLAQVSSIERYSGTRRHTARGALIGFLVGSVSGALLGQRSGASCEEQTSWCNTSDEIFWGVVLLGSGGLLLGAFIGSDAREQYQPVAPPWRIGPP